MSEMRSCIKPGCRWPAVATLSYRYATSEVWLSDLGAPHPATHDLCPHHADSMTVPRTWTLVDDRQPAEPVHEPSAAEIVERATKLRSRTAAMLAPQPEEPRPTSRYTALLALLPTYAPDPDQESEAGILLTSRRTTRERMGAHERPATREPATAVGPRRPAPLGPAARPSIHERSATRELTPTIRERVAELAGPVVGPIMVDLESPATVVQLPPTRRPLDPDEGN